MGQRDELDFRAGEVAVGGNEAQSLTGVARTNADGSSTSVVSAW